MITSSRYKVKTIFFYRPPQLLIASKKSSPTTGIILLRNNANASQTHITWLGFASESHVAEFISAGV